MELVQLTSLVPAPEEPLEPSTPKLWERYEASLDLVLPSDYKQFVDVYGTGILGEFVYVLNPFSQNEYVNHTRIEQELFARQLYKQQFGAKVCPYPLFPEPEGLLPWAVTENGDVLFWLRHGSPSEWDIVINESRGPAFERFPSPATAFLRDFINGKIESRIIPSRLMSKTVAFVPLKLATDRGHRHRLPC